MSRYQNCVCRKPPNQRRRWRRKAPIVPGASVHGARAAHHARGPAEAVQHAVAAQPVDQLVILDQAGRIEAADRQHAPRAGRPRRRRRSAAGCPSASRRSATGNCGCIRRSGTTGRCGRRSVGAADRRSMPVAATRSGSAAKALPHGRDGAAARAACRRRPSAPCRCRRAGARR